MSCKKFIQEDLHGIYTSATFYKTSDQALMALTSAYNDLLFNSSDNCIWVFGDVASDDAVKGSLAGDQLDIQYIDQFNVVSSNSELLSIWMRYYDAITRANIVLNQVPVTTGVMEVSPGFLPLFKATPGLGRGFQPGEDVAGSPGRSPTPGR